MARQKVHGFWRPAAVFIGSAAIYFGSGGIPVLGLWAGAGLIAILLVGFSLLWELP